MYYTYNATFCHSYHHPHLKQQTQDQRQVSKEEAFELAKKYGFYAYIECSAVTGENVDKTFLACLDAAWLYLRVEQDLRKTHWGFSAKTKQQARTRAYASYENEINRDTKTEVIEAAHLKAKAKFVVALQKSRVFVDTLRY